MTDTIPAPTTDSPSTFTVPGLDQGTGRDAVIILEPRLVSLIDLSLTLKHIHWNVVGPGFIAVHEMLDPQHAAVSAMVDEMAERIATLGGSPNGLPGHLVDARTWADYAVPGRAVVEVHLRTLDSVYVGVIADHRKAQAELAEVDPITEDLVVGQIRAMEQFQWFVRAHLECADGTLRQN